MTEKQWLAGDNPEAMLNFIGKRGTSDRKYRLFAVACAREELPYAEENIARFGQTVFGDNVPVEWIRDPIRGYEQAIVAAEVMADGGANTSKGNWVVTWTTDGNSQATAFAALGFDPDDLVVPSPEYRAAVIQRYRRHPSRYLHCLFGNPFRPVMCDPAWRTSDVLLLAKGIYDDRAFDRMPILADALQDAGCDSDDILIHCREANQPHARGCWVVDLVLGKG